MKVDLNTALNSLSGKIDGYVFRSYRGKQFAQKKPVFTKPWGEGTLKTRHAFREADKYWREVVKPDPALSRLYRERGKGEKLNYRQMALRDFFNPPKVGDLQLQDYRDPEGGTLVIDAQDDFEVMGVKVSLCDAAGGTIFAGEATARSGLWYFQVPARSPGAIPAAGVEVRACDRPGNVTTRKFALPIQSAAAGPV